MILLQKSSADSSLLAKARQSQPLHHENKSSQCSETFPPQSPSTCFPTHPPPYSCGHRGWKTYIRGRCEGTNSSTEDVLARLAATAMETEFTGDTYRSIPSSSSLSGMLLPFPITARVVCQDTLLCCGGEPLRLQAFHHAGRVGS